MTPGADEVRTDADREEILSLLAALDRETRLHARFASLAASLARENARLESRRHLLSRLVGGLFRKRRKAKRAAAPSLPAPRCSVIIPTWRENATLDRAVRSCLEQDIGRGNVEVLVCANGPAAAMSGALKERWAGEPSVKILSVGRADPNAARRLGVENASFPLLAFLDDDDALSPGFLGRLAAVMAPPSVQIAVGRVKDCGADGTPLAGPPGVLDAAMAAVGTAPSERYREFAPFLSSFCFKMFRTDFFRSAFTIRDADLPFGEDVLFWAENYANLSGRIACDSADSPHAYLRTLSPGSRSRPDGAAADETRRALSDRLAAIALDRSRPMPVRLFAVSKILARTPRHPGGVSG